MNETLISFRDFMNEISGGILSANELLKSYQNDCAERQNALPQQAGLFLPLRIKNVMVTFSAHASIFQPPEDAQPGIDSIFLDLVTDGKRQPPNLQTKILFAGDGAPLPLPPPQSSPCAER